MGRLYSYRRAIRSLERAFVVPDRALNDGIADQVAEQRQEILAVLERAPTREEEGRSPLHHVRHLRGRRKAARIAGDGLHHRQLVHDVHARDPFGELHERELDGRLTVLVLHGLFGPECFRSGAIHGIVRVVHRRTSGVGQSKVANGSHEIPLFVVLYKSNWDICQPQNDWDGPLITQRLKATLNSASALKKRVGV